MGPIEYDNDQKHKEYKSLLDTLKKKRISRGMIAKKIKVDKSTLTRIYNDKNPNPQRCLHYMGLIKTEFAQDLDLEVSETEGPYGRKFQLIDQKMDLLLQELQEIRESNARIEKALNIPEEE